MEQARRNGNVQLWTSHMMMMMMMNGVMTVILRYSTEFGKFGANYVQDAHLSQTPRCRMR